MFTGYQELYMLLGTLSGMTGGAVLANRIVQGREEEEECKRYIKSDNQLLNTQNFNYCLIFVTYLCRIQSQNPQFA